MFMNTFNGVSTMSFFKCTMHKKKKNNNLFGMKASTKMFLQTNIMTITSGRSLYSINIIKYISKTNYALFRSPLEKEPYPKYQNIPLD